MPLRRLPLRSQYDTRTELFDLLNEEQQLEAAYERAVAVSRAPTDAEVIAAATTVLVVVVLVLYFILVMRTSCPTDVCQEAQDDTERTRLERSHFKVMAEHNKRLMALLASYGAPVTGRGGKAGGDVGHSDDDQGDGDNDDGGADGSGAEDNTANELGLGAGQVAHVLDGFLCRLAVLPCLDVPL